ncbi:Transposable element Tc1 transposase [Nosema granulosis]|uniref:Transposable element Tc1 transposase n=1 Tax=Nosema granulosis TaxID=83296 RepID=A0A9P6KYT6_9MICR|nr:Transposable element Tc1 transposase [Nosema granulosis]
MEEEDIKRLIFNDESNFNFFYSDGKISVWRTPGTGLSPKKLQSTVKHGGGSIMVLVCFSYYGVGKLVIIDRTMNSVKYLNILSLDLGPSARSMGLTNYIFNKIMIPSTLQGLKTIF